MNKRQKKKQLVVRCRKEYKALKKYCQRRRLDNPKYDGHLCTKEIIFSVLFKED